VTMEFVSEVCKIVTAALQELSANEAELADLERKYTPPKSPYFIENIDRTAEFIAYKKHETALLEERQKTQESAEKAIATATAAYKKARQRRYRLQQAALRMMRSICCYTRKNYPRSTHYYRELSRTN
jgi:hypothetical protein